MKIEKEKVSIGVISDTHSHLDERIIDILKGCDYAVHAGDVCGQNVVSAMQPKSGEIFVVAGNNDIYCHDGEELPDVISFELPYGKVSIEHGHKHGSYRPCHDSMRETYSDSRLVVYGHTHVLVIDKTAKPWVINPGAAGRTRNNGGPSCLVLHCDNDHWDVESFSFEN